jgi:hypothetical protein
MLNKTGRDLKWKQDINTLTIEQELKRTNLKKITVTVGRRFLRLTCPEKNFAKVVDLFDSVITELVSYRVDYDNDVALVYIVARSHAQESNSLHLG